MKNVLLVVRYLFLVSILVLTGCSTADRKADGPGDVQVKNQVSVKLLPLDKWGSVDNPDTRPIQLVEKSESMIILPGHLLGDIENVAVKIKEKILLLNSRASVEIKDNVIIIKNIYAGNSNIKVKDLTIPDTMKGVKGFMLFLPETTWATMNTYPEAPLDNKQGKTLVNYEVCAIKIAEGLEITLLHGTVGAYFLNDGQKLSANMEKLNNPELAEWRRCRGI